MIAVLLLLATAAWAVPSLTIAYHREDHAAPLFDACLYPKDFRSRYRLYLKEVKPPALYTLVDGKRSTLSLRLLPLDSDSAVLSALRSDSAQVGILATEEVLAAVINTAMNIRIIAPLQHGGDLLIVNPSIPAANCKEFLAWVKAQNRPTTIGYIGQYSMAALGFTQALEYEKIKYTGTVPGRDLSPQKHTCAHTHAHTEACTPAEKPESTRVKLILAEDRAALAAELSVGTFDAAVLEEPAATWVSMLQGSRAIGRTDILPPGRFEDRPGTVIAAPGRSIVKQGEDLSRFLELTAVATHYANNNKGKTLAAVAKWLDAPPALESIAMRDIGFTSRPGPRFTAGIWSWYNALRLRSAVPKLVALPVDLDEKHWLRMYDSLLLTPALERAGARITK
jgi:ABC-type nitrate/sulfonate/bicarbonate transport system substrate-binding protein